MNYKQKIDNQMKKIYFLIGFFSIVLYSCTKEKESDPSNLPDSVQQHITQNCTCDPQIGLFRWDERVLYVHWYVGPACSTISSYYDEDGGELDLTTEEKNVFWEDKELVKMIWVCGE